MNTSKIFNIVQSELDPSFKNRSQVIIDTIIKKRPKKILDAGCGRGYYVTLASMLDFPEKIVGVDLMAPYIKIARQNTKHDKRVTIVRGSLEKLIFPNNYFDFIICSEVLEHVKNDQVALQELFRVLKKGGTLLVTVPNKNFPFLWDPLNWMLMRLFQTHIDKNIWWLAGMWADHERLYSLNDICTTIRKYFRIKQSFELTRWGWPLTHFILYGIGKNIVEKGLFPSLNRFNLTERGPATQLLSKIISLPSTYLDPLTEKGPAVNIIVVAEK